MKNRATARTISLVCLLSIITVASAVLAQDDFVPVYHPELEVRPATGSIDIDGVLGDEGWRGAAKADNFAEHSPGDQTKPPVDTEVYITYTSSNLYVAWYCHDNPDEVRASFCERDAIFNDDYVILCLDTFGDAVNAFEISANPYGIQGDLYYAASGGEDGRFDMIFKSAGQITDDGWIVEMEIPFSSLRFPGDAEQVWRVDFWRNRPRESREQYSWAAYDRDDPCWLCKWGTVTGIRDVESGKGLELLPAMVAHQSACRDDDGNFDNGPILGEVSFSGKYALSSNMTAELALNPDFSQIESDAAQIDVNTNFALFYSERRPFFQEGSDLFNTWFNAVYTRSINDPSVAAKVSGRQGKTSFALLSAKDEHSPIILPFEESSEFVSNGPSFSNILRVKQELADQTHLGIIATDRRYENDGSGSVVGLDARVKLSQHYHIETQYLQSYTVETDEAQDVEDYSVTTFDSDKHTAVFDGEKFSGRAIYASLEREGRNSFIDFDYWDRSPTFRADNGFETSNNSRTAAANGSYTFRFDDSELIERMSPSARIARSWNYDGQRQRNSLSLSYSLNLRKAQTNMHAQFEKSTERNSGTYFDNVWRWHNCLHLRPTDKVSCGTGANYGHRVYYSELVMGRQFDMWGDLDYKPIDRILLSTGINYSQSRNLYNDEEYFSGYVTRTRLNYQITRELSARLVIQYSSFSERWEADPLMTYKINPFSIFYFGSTRDYELLSTGDSNMDSWRLMDRQYFMKLQYLFQI